MPKISVITPCYNASRFLAQTLEGVRAQTLQEWEHIIVDDGSRDDSARIVEEHAARDARLRLLKQPNGGVCNARNNGFRAASPDSDYLLFLDADDVIEPTMLETLSRYLDEHPQVGLAFCGYVRVDEENRLVDAQTKPRSVPTRFGLRALKPQEARTPFVSILCGAQAYTPMALLRRSVYERTQGWDEVLGQHHEELDLFLRCALLAEVHFVPEKLLRYRRHSGQSSHVSAQQAQKFQTQWRKFQEKWKSSGDAQIGGASEEERRLIAVAWRVLEGRHESLQRATAARNSLRAGRVFAAARLFVGAMLIYARAFRPADCFAVRRLREF